MASLAQTLTIAPVFIALLAAPLAPVAHAQTNATPPPPIPTRPTAPTPLASPRPVEPYRCERYFLYRGDRYRCDSVVKQDGQQLRPIFEGVPEALAELDTYQKNRRNIRKAAYFGTAGLVLATASLLIAQQATERERGNTFRALSWGGLALSTGTVIYGVSLLRTNELHLGNAVQRYNEARPDDPIELLFTTGITF